MEVSFDTEKHNGAGAPVTRIYAPSHRNGPVYSRILMILAVFLIAGTAILAISGSAQIAKIYTEIHSLDSEISSYKEKISLLRKEQSTLNDYATINEANQNVGRVMSWNDH